MKIGDALRAERERLKLTQKEMIAGTKLSLSNYSRIENNERKIDADDLYELLSVHQISPISFMKRYWGLQNDVAEMLKEKIIENFTSHDLAGAKKTKAKIMALEDNQNLKYRAILIVAGMEKKVDQLDEKLKHDILSELFSSDDWQDNENNLRLFADSMLLFKFHDLSTVMHTFLVRLKPLEKYDTERQELIVIICMNYLENCYQNHSSKWAQETIDLVIKMPTKPIMYFYKTLATYYFYLLTDQKDKVMQLRKVMKEVGFENYIKILPY